MAAPTVFEAKLVFMWLVMGAGTGGDKQQAGCSGTIPQYRTARLQSDVVGGRRRRRRKGVFGCETMTDERRGVASSVYSRAIFVNF